SVLKRFPVPHQLLAGLRMLAAGQACELCLRNFSFQTPFLRELPVPFTPNLAVLVVVGLLRTGEFFGVIRSSLGGTERFRNCQHPEDSRSLNNLWLPGLLVAFLNDLLSRRWRVPLTAWRLSARACCHGSD